MGARGRVFISYRHKISWQMAQLVRGRLIQDGYAVFMDVTEMGSGPFVDQLLGEIRRCDHFLVVLEGDCLTSRCGALDWFRREIAEAIARRRNIVPLLIGDFRFPDDLPDDIAGLATVNGIRVWPEYVDEAMRQLSCRYLRWRVRPVPDAPAGSAARPPGRDAGVAAEVAECDLTEPVPLLPAVRLPVATSTAPGEPRFGEVMNAFAQDAIRGPRRRVLGRRRSQATG